ncbi:BON domain-containing protein [Pararhodobacter marinus]|nr:BON domain-containing protein [Pararhodobacter marinus]
MTPRTHQDFRKEVEDKESPRPARSDRADLTDRAQLTTGEPPQGDHPGDPYGAPPPANTGEKAPPAHRDDRQIQAAVRTALVSGAGPEAVGIEVSVLQGVVILRGTVPSAKAMRRAVDRARDCPGVVRVHNGLRADDPAR